MRTLIIEWSHPLLLTRSLCKYDGSLRYCKDEVCGIICSVGTIPEAIGRQRDLDNNLCLLPKKIIDNLSYVKLNYRMTFWRINASRIS